MRQHGLLQLLCARPPRRLVRFPDLPLEAALERLTFANARRMLQSAAEVLKDE